LTKPDWRPAPRIGHGNYRQNKTVVLGMVERGGKLVTALFLK